MENDIKAEINYYEFCSEGLTFSDPDVVYAIPATRETISNLLLDNDMLESKWVKRLQRTDIYVLSNLQGLPDDYDEDDPSQPLEKWWWHLRAIKEGKFPVKFLPSKKNL